MALPDRQRRGRPRPGIVAELRRLLAQSEDPPVLFDAQLVARFLAWSERKGNTPKWTRRLERLLTWWRTQLGDGRDLSELDLRRDVLPVLAQRLGARGHRVAALKALVTWLRVEEHLLDEDPLNALRVPQAMPAQWRRTKEVPLDDVRAAGAELAPQWRDALSVLLGTAWHVTELQRFARAGELRRAFPTEAVAGAGAWGVLTTRHKRRMPVNTAVSRPVFEAAARVRARGGLSAEWFARRLRQAAQRAGVEPWTPGRLRCTVSTHALASGSPIAEVASFLAHADSRTTRRWYTVHVASARVITPA